MAEGPGCQVDAGIIRDDCTLTDKAKKKFIADVINELTFGTAGLPFPPFFPCGVDVPANPFAELLDLENEEKFPDFHKNILGSYAKIACALNMPSDMKLLPICCPISLAFALGVDISLGFPDGFIPFLIPNPPLLALKMNLMPPPKLIAKFPGIPKIPPPLPKFDIPPKIDIDLGALFDFTLAFAVGIPKLLADIALQIPKLALKLPDLPGLFGLICDIALKSNLFGDILPDSIVQIVSVKVLTVKVVEMVFIAAVGTVLGSSPGGIVGGIGRVLEYGPEEVPGEEPKGVRDQIAEYALGCDGLSWGGGESIQEEYASKMLYVEYPEPGTGVQADKRALGKVTTIGMLQAASTCGLLARAALFAGGASYVFDQRVNTNQQDPNVRLYYDFYGDRYKVGSAISGIMASAKAKKATIPVPKGDLPPVKKGDVIIIYIPDIPGKEHAIVVVEDYVPGTFEIVTVEGGQPDINNGGLPTAIVKKNYIHAESVPGGSGNYSMFVDAANDVNMAGRKVLMIIDGEILCTDKTGADMTRSNGAQPTNLANDGPGFGFQKEDE